MAGDAESSHERTSTAESSDAELVRATRDGSRTAYAALYRRHVLGALRYAGTLTGSDAEDVVSEAFLKVYCAISSGHGPQASFRSYLHATVRNTYVSTIRSRRAVPAGDAIDDVVGDLGADVTSLRSFDGSATARAFLSLPTRWQQVLWYTEVEGYTRQRTAALLGMNANAVSALSFRARAALRSAWLQQHVSAQSELDRSCLSIAPLLGAYSQRGLSRRDRLRVGRHVTGCAHCTSVVQELAELLTPGRLALIALPVVFAGGIASDVGAHSGAVAIGVLPTAVLATGSGTTGMVALSMVGRVAACALIASLCVPPSALPSEHDERAQTASQGATVQDPRLDVGGVLGAEPGRAAVQESPPSTGPDAGVRHPEGGPTRTDASEVADEVGNSPPVGEGGSAVAAVAEVSVADPGVLVADAGVPAAVGDATASAADDLLAATPAEPLTAPVVAVREAASSADPQPPPEALDGILNPLP